ncbi:sulfurtransferase TusA family protein [Arsenophonus apicola]|uniref:Sulfurtransferase TusA family protein n=1 Tax=Arsenophonus apicola TaxID=2879119 RepID=A0ABY8P1W6_9GAMM|nr:sulfurtransferase TusA family protein [Arsenophonus apicola]WGO83197.1 sulfurtransferase TusA family protein [Arsenophonus apicola]
MSEIQLDTRGKLCPYPLIQVQKAIDLMINGDILIIKYDCAQATENIPKWAAKSGHEVIDFQQTGNAQWQITIKKGK